MVLVSWILSFQRFSVFRERTINMLICHLLVSFHNFHLFAPLLLTHTLSTFLSQHSRQYYTNEMLLQKKRIKVATKKWIELRKFSVCFHSTEMKRHWEKRDYIDLSQKKFLEDVFGNRINFSCTIKHLHSINVNVAKSIHKKINKNNFH